MAGAGAVALALLATFVPPTDSAQAASSCTGWRDTLTPPPSIRVYRTAYQRTVTVDFKRYVRTVMASEMGPTHPRASLRAGAVVIKQYGWYFAMHWRGGRDPAGRCYDVVDTTRDQVYNPSRTVYAIQSAVVNETWNWTLRKGASFFMTGYRAGNGICGSEEDRWHFMQRNATACVRRYGESTETILRRYYGADVSIVIPGANDMTGDGIGDSAALLTDTRTGEVTATLVTGDNHANATIGARAADGASPLVADLGTATVLGHGSVDVNHDGRRDLVQLLADPGGTLRIQVMRATGSGFLPAVTWWSSAVQGPALAPAGLHLVTGDFDDDGFGDAAIVQAPARTPASPTSAGGPSTRLIVFRSTGSALRPGVTWWRQSLNLSSSQFVAGDVSGDGRSDLVVLRPTSGGTAAAALVARSTNTGGLRALASYATVLVAPTALKPVVGDVDRDGRDDVILARRRGSGFMSILVLRSTAASTFVIRNWWSSTTQFDWSGSWFATTDANRDGRADLVAYRDGGPRGGTQVYRFTSTGVAFHASLWRTLPALAWTTLEAF